MSKENLEKLKNIRDKKLKNYHKKQIKNMKNFDVYLKENFEEDFEEGNGVYYAFLKQRGEGCDYTIGCAQTLIQIDADTFDDAVQRLEEIINENYFDETELQSCMLFSCPPKNIDLDSIYKRRQQRINREKESEKERKERLEYERLMKKYG